MCDESNTNVCFFVSVILFLFNTISTMQELEMDSWKIVTQIPMLNSCRLMLFAQKTQFIGTALYVPETPEMLAKYSKRRYCPHILSNCEATTSSVVF